MKQFVWLVCGFLLLAGCGRAGVDVVPAPDVPPADAGMPSNPTAPGEPLPSPAAPTVRATDITAAPATPRPGVSVATAVPVTVPGIPPQATADLASAMPVPPTATVLPLVERPVLEHFAVTTGRRVSPGASVSASWQVRHARQVSIRYDYYGAGDSRLGGDTVQAFLPAAAEAYSFTLAPPSPEQTVPAAYVVFTLHAANGVPGEQEGTLRAPIKEVTAQHTVPAVCAYEWFHQSDPKWCPSEAARVYPGAVAQRFERGLALYRPAQGAQPNGVLVLYDDGRTTGAMGFPVGTPPADLDVPAGLRAPAPEFYSPWAEGSGNSFMGALREELGWATGAPETFTFREQCEEGPPDQEQLCYFTGPGSMLYARELLSPSWHIP